MKIRKGIYGLFVACSACFAAGAIRALPTEHASAATIATVSVADFQMQYGASVRYGKNDGKDGIRFTAELSRTTYEKLEALQTTAGVAVNYGMLIVPADYTRAGSKTYKAPLTKETLFGASAAYTLVDCTPTENDTACTCGKTHISSVEYPTLSGAGETKLLCGSLVDLQKGNRTREFVGLGYIEYVNGSTVEYALAENAKSEDGMGAADIANNTRSMSYVAQLAIADGKDGDGSLYETYVQPFETLSYQYTIKHYLPDEAGNYGEPIVETAYAALGAEVEAKHIAESGLENASDYASYAAYTIDETNAASLTSSVVYANGKTVLACYYLAPPKTETEDGAHILCSFDSETETSCLKEYTLATSKTTQISYLAEYADGQTTKQGVALYQSDLTGTQGAYFYLQFDADMVDAIATTIWSAFNDEETAFSLQITLCISMASLSEEEVILKKGGEMEKTVSVGTWQTVTFTEEYLEAMGWTDESKVKKYLTGEGTGGYLFYVVKDNKANNEYITYYIDEISYTLG